MQAEGKLLASTPYGAKILEVLGSIYSLQAEMVLGGQSPPLSNSWQTSLPSLNQPIEFEESGNTAGM